jgi:hypothetical protein
VRWRSIDVVGKIDMGAHTVDVQREVNMQTPELEVLRRSIDVRSNVNVHLPDIDVRRRDVRLPDIDVCGPGASHGPPDLGEYRT